MRPARALCLLALLALLAPSTAAQGALEVSVPPIEGAQPEGPALSVPVTIRVPCSMLPNGTTQEGSVALLDAPPWLFADANDTTFQAGPCGADPQVVTLNLTYRLTPDAPAFAASHARLVARVREATAQTPFVVVAQGFAIVDVGADRTIAEAGPQAVMTFPLHVRNLGNGLTRVTIDVGALPAGWIVLKPQPVTLQARQDGGLVTEGTVNVVVQTPHRFGFLNEVAQIPVWLNATLEAGGNATDATNLTLTARVHGFDAPAPGTPLVAGAIVAAALAWRRRR